jgi:predicted HD phosphohydrolase
MTEVARSLDEVLDLDEVWGTELYDEEIRQVDHALQTAALAS